MGKTHIPKKSSGGPLLVTVDEAAGLLRISRAKAYEMISEGTLDSVKIGSMRRVKMASVSALAESGHA